MRFIKNLVLMISFVGISLSASAIAGDFFDLKATDIDGKEVLFSQFKGKVILAVNTASKCGFTKQFEALENLHQKYKDKGLVVLGFPSGDFRQELDDNKKVKYFCTSTYKVSFPMFEKIHVKGNQIHPVYAFLTVGSQNQFHGPVLWNFEKFLISKKGIVAERYRSLRSPDSEPVIQKIETLLRE